MTGPNESCVLSGYSASPSSKSSKKSKLHRSKSKLLHASDGGGLLALGAPSTGKAKVHRTMTRAAWTPDPTGSTGRVPFDPYDEGGEPPQLYRESRSTTRAPGAPPPVFTIGL